MFLRRAIFSFCTLVSPDYSLTACVVNKVTASKDELYKGEVDSKGRTSCYYLVSNQLTLSK